MTRSPGTGLLRKGALALALLSPAAAAGAGEFSQAHYAQMGLDRALQVSAGQGKGVSIAIIDTGIDYLHPELAARFNFKRSTCFGLGCDTPWQVGDDSNSHGTHVSGIAAAAYNGTGLVGIAPKARLVSVKVLNHNGSGSYQDVWDGILYARRWAHVLNLSLGPLTDSGSLKVLNQAALKRTVVVAAGNNGRDLSNVNTGSELANIVDGGLIFVGAVDSGNSIAYFSNKPGNACLKTSATGCYLYFKDIFMVAPGVAITSSVPDWLNGGALYDTYSGTSMATPMVSGAAALLMSQWSFLKQDPATLRDILFDTATDLGAPGVDAVYGRGLLNLAAALQPVGSLRIPAGAGVSGASFTPPRSAIAASAAFGDGPGRGIAGRRIIGLDEYDRDFAVNLAGQVARARAPGLDLLARGPAAFVSQAAIAVPGGSLTLAGVTPAEDRHILADPSRPGDAPRLAFALEQQVTGGVRLNFGQGMGLAPVLGIEGPRNELVGALQPVPVGLAHFTMAEGGRHAMAAVDFARGASIGLGFASSDNDSPSASFDGASSADALFATLSLSPAPGSRAMLVAGYAREEGSVLDARSDGALSLGSGARTGALGLVLRQELGQGWALNAGAAFGTTRVIGDDGLFHDSSALSSRALAAGIEKANALRQGDVLSLTVTQPLAVTSGSAGFTAPVGRTDDGRIVYESGRVNLAPTGRETRLDVGWTTPLEGGWRFDGVASLRHDADHVAGQDGGLVMGRLGLRF